MRPTRTDTYFVYHASTAGTGVDDRGSRGGLRVNALFRETHVAGAALLVPLPPPGGGWGGQGRGMGGRAALVWGGGGGGHSAGVGVFFSLPLNPGLLPPSPDYPF